MVGIGAGQRTGLRVRPQATPDGVSLAYLRWDHPNMPWDTAFVVIAADGSEHVIAGGRRTVVQPVWGEDLAVWWLSDRTDVPSLYRRRPHGEAELVLDVGSDIAGPQWVRAAPHRTAVGRAGRPRLRPYGADRLAVLEPEQIEPDLPYAAYRYVTAQGTSVVRRRRPRGRAGGPAVDVDGGQPEILRPARDLGLDPGWFSRPEHVTFPTEDRGTGIAEAHALVYPPTNPEVSAPEGAAAADGRRARRADRGRGAGVQPGGPVLDPRGFCVADVDYRGPRATAGGTDALQGRWGVLDLDDVVVGARFLAAGGSTRRGWRSAAARPAATRPWRR